MGNLSKNIAELRAQQNLSQEELAKRVGVSQPSIAQFEAGTKVPRLHVTIKLAKALNVTIDDLVNGKE